MNKINTSIDTLLNQTEDISGKVYGPVKSLSFNGDMPDKTIELVKMHLGYLKSFADLAKTKLNYTRHEYLLETAKNAAPTRRKGAK